MEVLLRKDIEQLGRMGEVVRVADGYARNYLLPRRMAVPVTPDNVQEIQKARQARLQREQEELARVGRQAEMLDGHLCYITARATDKGHLFGSVSAQQIVDHLAQGGFEGIRATGVSLDRPIQELGDYNVEIMLHPKVRVTVLVRVAREDEEE
ncbi:MAG: 50S ribosomal protein L9 [Candidatus Brocadiaceae bacterium]|nr:50S ribosomal protein L9 [Candidatus Brocadiaceae bacterium]